MRQEIMDKLTQAVAEKMGVDREQLQIKEVIKDNGLHLTGITVGGSTITAVAYVNGYVEELEMGETTFEKAAEEIAAGLTNIPDDIRQKAGQIVDMDRETFLDGIHIRLVNQAKNFEKAQEYPHFPFMDLIGVFNYTISKEATLRVTWQLADRFGVSIEELKEAGLKNMVKERKVATMADMMASIIPGGAEECQEGGLPIWVFTNESACYGATAMLDPDPFEDLAQELNSDLLILPSSVHEVLVLPRDEKDPTELLNLVKSVNGSVVAREDFLSDNVYQYQKGTGCIDVAV